MSALLFVRIRSKLKVDEFDQRILERKPKFMDVPGLIQKIYGRDPETDDVCGVYFFEDQQSLDAYRKSELANSIPSAYEALEVRRDVFDILFSLRPEVGPIE